MARVELPTTPPSPRCTRISFLRFHPPTVQKAYRARSKRAWHTSADTFCTGLGCDTWGLDHPPTRLTPRPGHNFLSESPLGFFPVSRFSSTIITNMHQRPFAYLRYINIAKRHTNIAGSRCQERQWALPFSQRFINPCYPSSPSLSNMSTAATHSPTPDFGTPVGGVNRNPPGRTLISLFDGTGDSNDEDVSSLQFHLSQTVLETECVARSVLMSCNSWRCWRRIPRSSS